MSCFARSALTATIFVSLVAVEPADAGSSDVVLDYLLMPAAGSSDLETLDGQIRAAIVAGEAGPVGISASSPPAVEAHFGALRVVVVPVPEPARVLQGISALTAVGLLRLCRVRSNRRVSWGSAVPDAPREVDTGPERAGLLLAHSLDNAP